MTPLIDDRLHFTYFWQTPLWNLKGNSISFRPYNQIYYMALYAIIRPCKLLVSQSSAFSSLISTFDQHHHSVWLHSHVDSANCRWSSGHSCGTLHVVSCSFSWLIRCLTMLITAFDEVWSGSDFHMHTCFSPCQPQKHMPNKRTSPYSHTFNAASLTKQRAFVGLSLCLNTVELPRGCFYRGLKKWKFTLLLSHQLFML